MDPPAEVCVLGRIGYDLYAVEHGRPLGEVEHFMRRLGGSSANIAVGLARLGRRVAIISCVADDALSDYLIGFLRQEGLDTRFVRRASGCRTSLCLTEVSPPGRFPQVFYRYQPADARVEVGEEELAVVRGARLFLTNGTSLAESPSREATALALRSAREAGGRTAFDVDYRASSWPSPEEAGRVARKHLPLMDVVIGNEEETALLTGVDEPAAQVKEILGAGASLLVRKRGALGVEAHGPRGAFTLPPLEVEVASTIGAGDGFAAGFLNALMAEKPLEECLRHGNAAAAVVVSRVSCSDAMPYPRELEAMLGRA